MHACYIANNIILKLGGSLSLASFPMALSALFIENI
jgi:hypothetical protein